MQTKLVFNEKGICTWPHFESEGFWNLEVAYLHDKICREVMTYASRAR